MYEMKVEIKTAKGSKTLPTVSTRASRAVQSYLEGRKYDVQSAELGPLESLIELGRKLPEAVLTFDVADNGFRCQTSGGAFAGLMELHAKIRSRREELESVILQAKSTIESAKAELDEMATVFPGYRERERQPQPEKTSTRKSSGLYEDVLAELG